jgi:hypothetical protein
MGIKQLQLSMFWRTILQNDMQLAETLLRASNIRLHNVARSLDHASLNAMQLEFALTPHERIIVGESKKEMRRLVKALFYVPFKPHLQKGHETATCVKCRLANK